MARRQKSAANINFRILYRHVGSDVVLEEICNSSEYLARATMADVRELVAKWFELWKPENVAKYEVPRELIGVEVVKYCDDAKVKTKHTWKKQSLVTESGGFDWYTCEFCRARGKRHGLQQNVVQSSGPKSCPQVADWL